MRNGINLLKKHVEILRQKIEEEVMKMIIINYIFIEIQI